MTTLADRYSGFICDLDGVVYRGAGAVAYAVESLDEQRAAGKLIAYATNNASRPPRVVTEHLASLGIDLEIADVVNSAQAGARRVAELVPAGARVIAVGGPGVEDALRESGLDPVFPLGLEAAQAAGEAVEPIAAVLQGYGPDVSWHDLAQAAFAIQRGAIWVATNADSTLPLAHGIAPGNGALVGAVRHAVEVDPVVVGKPYPPLYEYSAKALGLPLEEVLALGDRLDTDIAGAVNTGIDSLYVTTGVSAPLDVALAEPKERPTYLAMDLRALAQPYVAPDVRADNGRFVAQCGGARAVWAVGLELGDAGTGDERLRAFVAAVWAARDAGTQVSAAALTSATSWIEAGQR